MLSTLKTNYDVIGKRIADCEFELQEKVKKYTENEEILAEPVPPPEVIRKMEARLNQVRATTVEMELRLVGERDKGKEDKLAIFRQQVSLIVKRKGELEDEIRSLIEERTQNELMINQKRKDLVGLSGNDARTRLLRKDRHHQIPGGFKGEVGGSVQKEF